MKNKKVIIFDFDGTIADTLDMGVKIFNKVADEYNCMPVKQEDIEKLRSKKPKELMRDFGITKIKLPFLLLRIRKELNKHIADIKPIGNIDKALEEIKSAGFNMGILSSNSKENVSSFLNKNNLVNLFDFIYTGKNIFGKNRVLSRLFREKNISKEDAVYIGDEVRDIEAATKVGVSVVAVSWGFNSKEILEASHPDKLVDKSEELLEAIQSCRTV